MIKKSYCGKITIENGLCYQDLVGILISNGYTVELTPLRETNKIDVVISKVKNIEKVAHK